MSHTDQCELMDLLRREAVEAILCAKQMRRSKDVSLYEDSALCKEQRRKIDAFIAHLLSGHDGKPCPCGDRPIVGARGLPGLEVSKIKFPEPSHPAQKN